MVYGLAWNLRSILLTKKLYALKEPEVSSPCLQRPTTAELVQSNWHVYTSPCLKYPSFILLIWSKSPTYLYRDVFRKPFSWYECDIVLENAVFPPLCVVCFWGNIDRRKVSHNVNIKLSMCGCLGYKCYMRYVCCIRYQHLYLADRTDLFRIGTSV